MGDVIFVLASLAFFGLCWLYVRGCEWLIKSDEEAPGTGGGGAMTFDNVVGLILAVLLAAYLVAALVLPERF